MMIDAWYDRIEVPIDDDIGQYLYVVKYTVDTNKSMPEYEFISNVYSVYDKESTAKAVVEAIKKHLI
jgi:hypothetical protein